jgi:hypothetical protein
MYKNFRLDEASLGRAYQHAIGKGAGSYGMVTAYRYVNTPEENDKLNKELEKDIRALGYGFFKVEGHWRECQDPKIKYADCPSEKLVDSTEESLFVPGISKDQIDKLGKKYGQDGVIYGGKDTKGNAVVLYRDGGVDNLGKFHPDKVAQGFSKMKNSKGNTFAFAKGKPKTQPDLDKKAGKPNINKLSSVLPKGIMDKTVKNPDTGKQIKLATALRHDKNSPVHRAAALMIRQAKK